jgi:hypothetical protein
VQGNPLEKATTTETMKKPGLMDYAGLATSMVGMGK